MSTIVRVRNEGTEKFAGKYAGTRYELNPGDEIMVPVEAAILWTGDPDTRDIDAKNKDRTDEYMRLGFRYGCMNDLDAFKLKTPKLGVFLQDNTRITTVIDDPLGEKYTGPQFQGVQPAHDNPGARAEALVNKIVNALADKGIDVAALLAGEENFMVEQGGPDVDVDDVTEDLLDEAGIDPDAPDPALEQEQPEIPRAQPVKKPPAKKASRPVAPAAPRVDGQ